ncbi:MAG: GIY-YIG nuclease family protein [Halanaerobiaceae bacterium]
MKEIKYDSGIYLLEILLDNKTDIKVGKKGKFSFPAGYYYYSGSAQRILKSRLKRHLSKDKKLRWHIDYLIDKGKVLDFHTWPAGKKGECVVAGLLQSKAGGKVVVPGFGSSDCKCNTHLYYFERQLDKSLLPDKIKIGSVDIDR